VSLSIRSFHALEKLLQNLIFTRVKRRRFLAAMPWFVAACASLPAPSSREQDYEFFEISVDNEKHLADEVAPQIEKDYPPINNSTLQNYVNDVGQMIVKANGFDNGPYQYSFTLVGVSYVNAFSLPAGKVFITAALLDLVETEAELAGVLAHELGHIKARHAAERIEILRAENKKEWLKATEKSKDSAVGKLLCAEDDKTCIAGIGGLLVQKYSFMANGREDEMEADRIGFRAAVACGYSKNHVGNFYSKLLLMDEERKKKNLPVAKQLADALSTHPPSKERVLQMRQMAEQTPEQAEPIITSKLFVEVQKITREWLRSHA